MKLFFDESVGTRVPGALQYIGIPAEEIARPTRSGPVALGMPDREWIPLIGAGGFLVVSHDLRMLAVPAERDALASAQVGAVFVDAGSEPRWRVLRLLLGRWEWLERIDSTEERPFAYRLPLRGRPRKEALS